MLSNNGAQKDLTRSIVKPDEIILFENGSADIDAVSQNAPYLMFDLRTAGVSPYYSVTSTLERTMAILPDATVEVVGAEKISGHAVTHVRMKSRNTLTEDFWISDELGFPVRKYALDDGLSQYSTESSYTARASLNCRRLSPRTGSATASRWRLRGSSFSVLPKTIRPRDVYARRLGPSRRNSRWRPADS